MSRFFILSFFAVLACSEVNAKATVITSTPSGAEVSVDGRVLGRTPLTTDRKTIMPGWASDGRITQVTISIELPMHISHSVTVSEWSIPKSIEAVLKQDVESIHFENYLESVLGLDERTERHQALASLFVSDDLNADSLRMEQNGYVLVGYVGVSAPIVPIEFIREKVRALEGEVILVRSSDAGVQTEMRAVRSTTSGGVVSSFGNSFSNSSVTAHASGSSGFGSAAAIGTGSALSSSFSFVPSSSTTTWVPYERRQFSTQATVWRKRKTNSAGLALDPLPTNLRTELQRNSGAFVSAVAEGSRAFLSDILVGDVIVELAGSPVRQASDVERLLAQLNASEPVSVIVLRNGAPTAVELINGE